MNPTTQQELENAFDTLREQAIVLRQTFNTFDILFSSGHKIQCILTKSAASFFHDLNAMMIEYLILMICRITDRPETAGNPNLTIPWMTKEICKSHDLDKDARSEIRRLDKCIRSYRKLMKPVRNKIVSHIDLETHTMQRILGGHSQEEMRKFFENLQNYFDVVGNAIGVGPLDFSSSSCQGDVHDLIKVLRQGLNFTDNKE